MPKANPLIMPCLPTREHHCFRDGDACRFCGVSRRLRDNELVRDWRKRNPWFPHKNYLKHRDKIRAKAKAHYHANKSKHQAWHKQWYEANKERVRLNGIEYRKANAEKLKLGKAAYRNARRKELNAKQLARYYANKPEHQRKHAERRARIREKLGNGQGIVPHK